MLSNLNPANRKPFRRQAAARRLAPLALGLAVLALAACEAGPARDPARQASEAALAQRYGRLVPASLVWSLPDGARLPVRVWPSTSRARRGVVLALHGFNDSRDAWEYAAPVLAARGFAVYAPDQEGFGETRSRGGWVGTARLVEDAAEMVRATGAAQPGLPIYVMGESMGGAVALLLAARADHPPVAGFVLLAPAVWSRGEMSPLMRLSLFSASTFAPRWQLTGRAIPVRIRASDNDAALYRLGFDPLTLGATRVSVLEGLVGLMTQAAAAAPQVEAPTLIAYGAHDELVPPAAMDTTWRQLPRSVRRAYYWSGWHLLTRDRGRRSVLDDLASWMTDPQRPLPSGADVAAAAWTAGPAADRPVPAWLPAGLDSLADGGASRSAR